MSYSNYNGHSNHNGHADPSLLDYKNFKETLHALTAIGLAYVYHKNHPEARFDNGLYEDFLARAVAFVDEFKRTTSAKDYNRNRGIASRSPLSPRR